MAAFFLLYIATFISTGNEEKTFPWSKQADKHGVKDFSLRFEMNRVCVIPRMT